PASCRTSPRSLSCRARLSVELPAAARSAVPAGRSRSRVWSWVVSTMMLFLRREGGNAVGMIGRGGRLVDQIIEQRAIMNHRLAKILGAGFAARMTQGDLMGGAIILHDLRVIDRKIGRALLEIHDRIAAALHHAAEQIVGMGDGRLGIVDELGLHLPPLIDIARALFRRQRPDREFGDALLALMQQRFRLAGGADLRHRPLIFGAEPRLEIVAPPSLEPEADRDRAEQDHERDQDDFGGGEGSHITLQSCAYRLPAQLRCRKLVQPLAATARAPPQVTW